MRRELALLTLLLLAGTCWAGRTFDGSADFFEATVSDPFGAYPFSFACWFKCDTDCASSTLMFIGDKDATSIYYAAAVTIGAPSTATVVARNTSAIVANTTNSFDVSLGEWHHIVCVFTDSTHRSVYLDGNVAQAGAENSSSANYNTAVDRISLGHYGDSTPTAPFKGTLAHAAMWNKVLGSTDIGNLYTNKYAPSLVQVPNLVAYWKLAEANASDSADDEQNTYDLTDTSDPGVAAGPTGIVTSLTTPSSEPMNPGINTGLDEGLQ